MDENNVVQLFPAAAVEGGAIEVPFANDPISLTVDPATAVALASQLIHSVLAKASECGEFKARTIASELAAGLAYLLNPDREPDDPPAA
jgi:hypothetical protein